MSGFCVALSACGNLPQISNPFNSDAKPESGGWSATVTESSMMNAAREGGDVNGATGGDCPFFGLVSQGEGIVTMKATGPAAAATDAASSVLHRGEITKTARECTAGPGGGMTVKYGFSGRVLLGPQGKPGNITLSVKVTIVDGGRKTVKTEAIKVPVTVGAGEAVGYFSMVRDIAVPVAPGVAPQNYKVYVAFDRSVPGAS